jgi:hypothetical protein
LCILYCDALFLIVLCLFVNSPILMAATITVPAPTTTAVAIVATATLCGNVLCINGVCICVIDKTNDLFARRVCDDQVALATSNDACLCEIKDAQPGSMRRQTVFAADFLPRAGDDGVSFPGWRKNVEAGSGSSYKWQLELAAINRACKTVTLPVELLPSTHTQYDHQKPANVGKDFDTYAQISKLLPDGPKKTQFHPRMLVRAVRVVQVSPKDHLDDYAFKVSVGQPGAYAEDKDRNMKPLNDNYKVMSAGINGVVPTDMQELYCTDANLINPWFSRLAMLPNGLRREPHIDFGYAPPFIATSPESCAKLLRIEAPDRGATWQRTDDAWWLCAWFILTNYTFFNKDLIDGMTLDDMKPWKRYFEEKNGSKSKLSAFMSLPPPTNKKSFEEGIAQPNVEYFVVRQDTFVQLWQAVLRTVSSIQRLPSNMPFICVRTKFMTSAASAAGRIKERQITIGDKRTDNTGALVVMANRVVGITAVLEIDVYSGGRATPPVYRGNTRIAARPRYPLDMPQWVRTNRKRTVGNQREWLIRHSVWPTLSEQEWHQKEVARVEAIVGRRAYDVARDAPWLLDENGEGGFDSDDYNSESSGSDDDTKETDSSRERRRERERRGKETGALDLDEEKLDRISRARGARRINDYRTAISNEKPGPAAPSIAGKATYLTPKTGAAEWR